MQIAERGAERSAGTLFNVPPDASFTATAPICPACWSSNLAKIKGCVRCLACGFKEDCNGF